MNAIFQLISLAALGANAKKNKTKNKNMLEGKVAGKNWMSMLITEINLQFSKNTQV